ncbi:hypothetical protein [Mesorhizobium sp.]|uniref:hypothetical protein n=1 Tax=Mesorhizobium sp. TaxID=1871066 RepID=UPI002600B1D7|nr:hypothetical protein [Mesorhizobium sp.]
MISPTLRFYCRAIALAAIKTSSSIASVVLISPSSDKLSGDDGYSSGMRGRNLVRHRRLGIYGYIFGYDSEDRFPADYPRNPEIDEFKGAWRALGTLAPERLSALRRVATIENIGASTRIEGSELTDAEVKRLLANLDIKSFETRDEQEVAGYAQVMETIFSHFDAIDLTETTSCSCTVPAGVQQQR